MIAVTRRSALVLLVGLCLALLLPAGALAAPYSGGAAPSSGAAPSGGAAPAPSGSPSGSSSGGVSPSSAAQGAFGVGLPQNSPPTPAPTQTQAVTPVATTAGSAGGSVSGTEALLVALGAIVVLGVIAYFIWSDSRHHVRLLRRAAPASGPPTGGPGRGSKAPPKSRKLTPAERRRRKRGRAR